MTVDEFGIFADAIKTYFPKDNMLPTDKAMDLWFDMLKDLSYESAYMALKKHVATSPFPPKIADIRGGATDFIAPQELNEMEAWSLVSKAIRNSGYNSVEEFEKLPPLVQKAVGLPDQLRVWAFDERYNEGVVRGHFINCYKVVLEREREIQKMPKAVRDMIAKINENSYSGQIEKKRQKAIEESNIRKQKEIMALESKSEYALLPEEYKYWKGMIL